MLTVAELIELLKSMPQDAPVAYESDCDAAYIAQSVEVEDGVVVLHLGKDR